MDALIEFLTEGSIPLISAAISCVLSIFFVFSTRIKKNKNAGVENKINGHKIIDDNCSEKDALNLLSRFSDKDQTLNQSEDGIILKGIYEFKTEPDRIMVKKHTGNNSEMITEIKPYVINTNALTVCVDDKKNGRATVSYRNPQRTRESYEAFLYCAKTGQESLQRAKARYEAFLCTNARYEDFQQAKARYEAFLYAKELIKAAESQPDIPTQEEARRRMLQYRDCAIKDGEGCFPYIVSKSEYDAALRLLHQKNI